MLGIHRSTAAGGAVDERVDFLTNSELEEIRLHLDAPGGSGELTVTIDSAAGARYDTVIFRQDMTEVRDLHYRAVKPIRLGAGDALKIVWENTGNKTYGLEVLYDTEWSG